MRERHSQNKQVKEDVRMKFLTGTLVATRGIHFDMIESPKFRQEIDQCLTKYLNCDWGDTHEADKPLNDEAVKNGERILAAYETSKGKIWIITEWNRSATTILYPDEY